MSNLKKQKAISLGVVFFCLGIGCYLFISAKDVKPYQTRGYQFYFTPEQTQIMIKGLESLSIKEAGDTYGTAMAQIQQQNAAAQQAQQKSVVKDSTNVKKKQ